MNRPLRVASLAVAALTCLCACQINLGLQLRRKDGGPSEPAIMDGAVDAAQCGAGERRCDGACVFTAESDAHCGACGVECGAAQSCLDGGCVENLCDAPERPCGASGERCVELAASATDCGRCGNECPSGALCVGGVCDTTCRAPRTMCGPSCVDTSTSAAHCGGCDSPCGSGEECVSGTCTAECGAGNARCSSLCVDTDVDPEHCGGCDSECASGTPCSDGSCGCAASETVCGDSCVDTESSETHCGACDSPCVDETICIRGECQASPCRWAREGECRSCYLDEGYDACGILYDAVVGCFSIVEQALCRDCLDSGSDTAPAEVCSCLAGACASCFASRIREFFACQASVCDDLASSCSNP